MRNDSLTVNNLCLVLSNHYIVNRVKTRSFNTDKNCPISVIHSTGQKNLTATTKDGWSNTFRRNLNIFRIRNLTNHRLLLKIVFFIVLYKEMHELYNACMRSEYKRDVSINLWPWV